jgi:hypothetical protein
MKSLITRTLASLALTIVGLGVAAPAQTVHVVKVNIPFEFSFGDRMYPAGDYSLTQPLQNMVTLRDSNGRTIGQVLSVGIESLAYSASPKLRFANADGRYILTEVWDGQDNSGQQVSFGTNRTLVGQHHSIASREAAEGSQP